MIFCMKINIEVFYKLNVSFLLVIARYAQTTQNSKFVISLKYLKKERRDEVDSLHADKHQTFLQVDPSNLGGHGNSKFVISLKYLKKERRDEVDFLHADKHQTYLQVDPTNLGGHGKACPSYPK